MLLTVEEFVGVFGEEECLQIAGIGPREFRELDRPKIEEAITHASALIVGYVQERWPQAVAGTPLLKGFAADIARWRLRGRGGQQTAMNETVQKRYDEAIGRLKDIAVGKLALDVEGGVTDAASADAFAVLGSSPVSRVPDMLNGWRHE